MLSYNYKNIPIYQAKYTYTDKDFSKSYIEHFTACEPLTESHWHQKLLFDQNIKTDHQLFVPYYLQRLLGTAGWKPWLMYPLKLIGKPFLGQCQS